MKNTLLVLWAVIASLALTACGARTEGVLSREWNEMPLPVPSGSITPIGTQPPADTGAPNDTGVAIDSGAPGSDADTVDAPKLEEGLLAVSFDGPPARTVINGQKRVTFLTFKLKVKKMLEFRILRVSFSTKTLGCAVKGSKGTNYLRNIRILATDSTVMGPAELKSSLPNRATETGTIELFDTFLVDWESAAILQIAADFSETQDAPGELIGCSYVAKLEAFTSDYDVLVYETRAAVTAEQVVPNGPISGNTVTVKPHGWARIVDYDLEGHKSRVVVGGRDSWEPFAGYMLCASTEEDALVTSLTVVSGTDDGLKMDNADFTSVGIRLYGEMFGTRTLPPGLFGKVTIPLSKPIWAPKGGACTPFQIVAKVANVQASSTVSGSWSGVCRSGHAPALGLAKDPTDSERFDIEAMGKTTGMPFVALSKDAHRGQPMIVRKSKPTLKLMPLTTTKLANIDQDLIKFQVAADSDGSIAWKQIIFEVAKTSGIVLTNFRLRRGPTDLDLTTYAVTHAETGFDVRSGPLTGAGSTFIAVSSKPGYEELISGFGSVYTLHATVAGAVAGQSVTTAFVSPKIVSSAVITAALTNKKASMLAGESSNLFNLLGASDVILGDFVWSDNSEVPHSPALGTVGGSIDWTNGHLIADLSGSVTLSL